MIRWVREDHVHLCFQSWNYLDAVAQEYGEVVLAEVGIEIYVISTI